MQLDVYIANYLFPYISIFALVPASVKLPSTNRLQGSLILRYTRSHITTCRPSSSTPFLQPHTYYMNQPCNRNSRKWTVQLTSCDAYMCLAFSHLGLFYNLMVTYFTWTRPEMCEIWWLALLISGHFTLSWHISDTDNQADIENTVTWRPRCRHTWCFDL